jgi:DNA polymerase III subunit gamma/tau
MLYNEYRPMKFNEIIGQTGINILLKQSQKDRYGHSYLFHGASGSGKTTTARVLAASLLCTNKVDGEPCGQCETCKEVANGRNLNVHEIDAGRMRGIDDIKALCFGASVFGWNGQHKIYIIDECHCLTKEGFGALLKLLEDTPKHVTIILCTTERHLILDTIASRCQQFAFNPLEPVDIVKRIKALAMAENVQLDCTDIETIASESNGNMRTAETKLEQVLCLV